MLKVTGYYDAAHKEYDGQWVIVGSEIEELATEDVWRDECLALLTEIGHSSPIAVSVEHIDEPTTVTIER